MQAGKLRNLVTIQAAAETLDPTGDVVRTWETHARAWAGIETATGGESINADQTKATGRYTLVTRYVPGVTAAMRVLLGSRTLHIESVENIEERNRELRLACREVA